MIFGKLLLGGFGILMSNIDITSLSLSLIIINGIIIIFTIKVIIMTCSLVSHPRLSSWRRYIFGARCII